MIAWVVIYQRHLRRSRQSGSLSRLFLFDIPTCKPSNVSTFGFPYTLPSSVSRNLFVCHSYENCRGVYQQFPFWNELDLSAPRGQSSPSALLKCLLFTSLRTLLHEPISQPFCFQLFPHSLSKTTRGGGSGTINVERKSGGSFCRCIPTSLRPYFFPQGTASARRADYRQSPRAAGTVAAAAQALSPSILSRCG